MIFVIIISSSQLHLVQALSCFQEYPLSTLAEVKQTQKKKREPSLVLLTYNFLFIKNEISTTTTTKLAWFSRAVMVDLSRPSPTIPRSFLTNSARVIFFPCKTDKLQLSGNSQVVNSRLSEISSYPQLLVVSID